MINPKILKARMKRNGFKEFAGKHFVDEDSEIIKRLNAKDKRAYIGIRKKGMYTIACQQILIYKTRSDEEKEIALNLFLEKLKEHQKDAGIGFLSRFRYKYVRISKQDKVWMKNSDVAFSFWNTILWIEKCNHPPEPMYSQIKFH